MKRYLFTLFSLCLLTGCHHPAEDAALERDLDYYCSRRTGSPAEFKADYVRSAYGQRLRAQLLDQKVIASNAQARGILTKLRDDIRLGWDWPSPPSVTIPCLKNAPLIDGDTGEAVWKDALTFRQEIPLNTRHPRQPATIWRIGYDREYLYWCADIPDADIQIDREKPYQADSLELFIMPDIRLRTYCEIVIHPEPGSYTKWCTTGHGGVYLINPWNPNDFQFAAKRTSYGYSVEGKIAFRELPGYLLGNTPKSGETICFQLIRTDRSNGVQSSSAPVPFLYDGHNIYGYIRGTLE